MPNNEWNPPAPDLKSEFNEASREEPERKIVTAAERDHWEGELAKLQVAQPETIEEEIFNMVAEEALKEKVREMNERLASVQLRKKFNSSR